MPEDEKKVASRRPSPQSTSEALISEKRNAQAAMRSRIAT